jgi:hypothetical protein
MARNTAGTLLASAARTATTSSSDQQNYSAKGVRVFINVTVHAVSAAIVPTIEVKDPISGTYTAILTGASITTTGHTVLTAYPGATVAAGVTLAIPLSKTWRVTMTPGNANSATYSVGYSYIV